jgi:MoaA/NifB/PqqE/SkfB family radical SAM enzyme
MRSLKINLLYQCTAKCSHCRFSCSNDRVSDTPDFETPYNVAKQLKADFGLDSAVILGGEPSIFASKTHELLSKISDLGVSTRLETNAGWAVNSEAAISFLKPLVSSNTSVMFSLDAFHEPYVSFNNILYASQACVTLGLQYILEIPYLDLNTKDNPIDVRTQELELRIRSMIKDVNIYTGNVLFIGRAAYTHGDEFSRGKGIPKDPCTKVPWWIDSEIDSTDLLILEPDGWITKGCGIAIGNVHKQNFTELIKNYKASDNPIFSILLKEGPIGLANIAEKYGYTIKKDYADPCHLCHESRQVLKDIYPDVLQPQQHYILNR